MALAVLGVVLGPGRCPWGAAKVPFSGPPPAASATPESKLLTDCSPVDRKLALDSCSETGLDTYPLVSPLGVLLLSSAFSCNKMDVRW